MNHKKRIFLIAMLLSAGASVLWGGDIHKAVSQGELGRIGSLLKENPELLEARDENNLTPLLVAAIEGRIEAASLLIKAGADLEAGDNEGSTALHNASALGHLEMVKFLIGKGADVGRKDNNGMTPLLFALGRGHGACAVYLLENGADPGETDANSRTPLFFAASTGDLNACRMLVEKGADVNHRNRYQRTPLLYAIWRNQKEAAQFLMDHGADPDIRDTDGMAVLHYACMEGQEEFARMILDQGGDPALSDNRGMAPVHLAAGHGQGKMVELLVGKGVNVNARTKGGSTPLHAAAWSGDTETIGYLLKIGAEVNAKNSTGHSPLDYAIMARCDAAAGLLRERKGVSTVEEPVEIEESQKEKAGLSHVKMTILYDNYGYVQGGRPEWGFSCLIEGAEKTILFDTGGNGEALMHNIDLLGVDLEKVDLIVISHDHWDHKGGLKAALERKTGIPVYLLAAFPYETVRMTEEAGGEVKAVRKAAKICEHVYTTGEMGDRIKEQSLILKTARGLVIVTGCSHQGIVNILKKAKEMLNQKIYLVFGGFHLMQHSEDQVQAMIQEFRNLGVEKCGATHCTGDRQIAQFRDAFKENYAPMGVGRVIEVK
jgi:7,8-dihydropterin-6-yl-methyl-4-(beta-D-ribofuranosyl)aminobenzene 5'-phosphate synthase